MQFKITPSKIKKFSTLLVALILLIASIDSNDSLSSQGQSQLKSQSNLPPHSSTTESVYDNSSTSFRATVKGVVDGDTIKISMLDDGDSDNRSLDVFRDTLSTSSKTISVRLIGINTPETVDPRRPVECFGKEASNKAKEILSGQNIRVELDPTQGTKDKYGRFLAYIYLEKSGLFFNKYMIEQGYAYEYTYDMPYKYQSQFKEAERVARVSNRGLWAAGVCVNI